jgi:hypothetical protein
MWQGIFFYIVKFRENWELNKRREKAAAANDRRESPAWGQRAAEMEILDSFLGLV